jgi:hypothetical protein
MDILNHWRYFLSLEKEFCETLRYVEFDDNQQKVYSFEYARLLILICSELDVVFKIISEKFDNDAKVEKISQYYEILSKKYDLNSEPVYIDRFSKEIKPFLEWRKNKPPTWWTAHNKIKHERHKSFEKASLINTLSAICGLYLANFITLSEFNLVKNVNEWPILVDREHIPSNAIMLQAAYKELKLVDSYEGGGKKG